jgi:hypothetical protein
MRTVNVFLTYEAEDWEEAAGEEEADHNIREAVHAQIQAAAAHQSAPRAEKTPDNISACALRTCIQWPGVGLRVQALLKR